jgi:hypothetical protein
MDFCVASLRAGFQVQETTIEFSAKVSSVSSTTNSVIATSSNGTDTSITNMAGSFSSQTERGIKGTDAREFSLKVKVTAVQDEMPVGLAKVLSALEDAILQD